MIPIKKAFHFRRAALAGAVLFATGCVHRVLTVTSEPSGALVEMNSQEVGRTPFTREFTWYGNYDVVLRADGYESLHTNASVPAPFWQWIPLDLFTELLPVTDNHPLHFILKPTGQPDPAAVLIRAESMRAMLETTENTTTRPTTKPTTRPSKKSNKQAHG